MKADDIRELFRNSELSWIANRLRVRMERGKALTGVLTLSEASSAQRSALDGLLGRRGSRGAALSLRIEALVEATGVREASEIVNACFGEVENRRAKREQRASRWDQVFDEALERLRRDAAGSEWISSLRDGLLRRLASSDPDAGRALIGQAVDIWDRMPFDGRTLAELAAETTGDTHALDRGRPLSPLLLRGLKFRTGFEGNRSAELRRFAWEAVGVVVDRISAPALTFNLKAARGTELARILDPFRELVQPAYLTYQSLREANPFHPLPPGMARVFVVENPAVVEVASARLGRNCAPLICTEGQPASAVKRLLRMLGDAGARIWIHADFDWSGLSFVDQLLAIPNTVLWRMDAATFRSAKGTVELKGKPFDPAWGEELVGAMKTSGCAVFEEQLLTELLRDLQS